MTTAAYPSIELNRSFAGVARVVSRWLAPGLVPTRKAVASNVSLAPKQMQVLTGFRGGSIECTEGCVWLTHDGDCRDVVLEAGQQHVADREARLVIYAIASSGIRLVPPAAA